VTSIDHLLAQQATERLIMQVYRQLDLNDMPPILKLFAPDGVWVRQGNSLKGHENILEGLKKRPPKLKTVHVVTNILFDSLTADSASASYYITAFRENPDDPAAAVPMDASQIGTYAIKTKRVGGNWLITHIDNTVTFRR
jgi:hypothetical protein